MDLDDDRNGKYDKKIQFKTTVLSPGLWDYSDAYILVEGKKTVAGQEGNSAEIGGDRNNKEVVFKNYAAFIRCISKINNAEVDHAEILDIVMPMYNLLEYSENYVKTLAIYGNIFEMNQMIT